MLTTREHPQLLFYDGDCSFCARWIAKVIAADKARRIRFAKLQGRTFEQVLEDHPGLEERNTVVLVQRRSETREDIFVRSTAIRKIVTGLPGFRFFSWILHLVPTPISDLGYRLVALLREPLFGLWADCRPDFEKNRDRFLD
jgi:predicted DCC family thiol-disulfide oxidoreductase YuxK